MPVDPNNKARTFNQTGVVAGTSVFSANVTPSESPVVFEISVAVNQSTRVDLTDFDGTTEFNHTLNAGGQIGGTELYVLPAIVDESSEYNVQFRKDVDVHVLQIDERGLEGKT